MFLRSFLRGVFLLFIAYNVLAQESKTTDTTRLVTKLVTRESFDIQRFQEGLDQYADDQKRSHKCSFLTLSNLARIASGQEADAFDCMNSLLGKTIKKAKKDHTIPFPIRVELAVCDGSKSANLNARPSRAFMASEPWRKRLPYSA